MISVVQIQPPADIPLSIPAHDWTIVREWLRKQRSQHTRRSYKRNIDSFYQRLGLPLREMTLTNLQDYADMIEMEHAEVSTQAQILASIKSLFTFAHRTGKIPVNVGAAVPLPQPKNKLAERILDETDLHKILIQAERSGNKRNYLLVLLLYASACRSLEICHLRWHDCQSNRDTGQITVQGKRGKTRSIVLHPKAWRALVEQKAERRDVRPDDYVFPSRQANSRGGGLTESRVWQIVSEIAKDAGVKASPYFLRHTHASNALRRKVSLKILQETMGHESLATTGRYLHVRPEESSSNYLDL